MVADPEILTTTCLCPAVTQEAVKPPSTPQSNSDWVRNAQVHLGIERPRNTENRLRWRKSRLGHPQIDPDNGKRVKPSGRPEHSAWFGEVVALRR